MPTDDDDDPGFMDAAEGFLSAFGAGEDWRAAVDEMFDQTGVDPEQAVTAGIAAGEQAARVRNQSRSATRAQSEPDKPILHTRDIENEDGRYIGTRIICSDPAADLFESERSVLLRSGPYDAEVPVPREIAQVTRVDDSEGAAEWIVRPELTDDAPDDAPDEAVEDGGDDGDE